MGNSAIKVEGLSKRYFIGHLRDPRDGLRHQLERVLSSPWKYLLRQNAGKYQREEFWALSDVSFEVKQGEVIGVIGRNGAGKSTLLKVLSRITEPTLGCARLNGRVASLLEVGTGFHPELTGRENIFLNGAILGMSRKEIRKRFDEIVAFSEVEQFLDTPVKRYSSGMYVRLAFAVAAHLEAEILIVDEVLAVGDVEFQKKCLRKMDETAHNSGRTILFVSHNMAAIQAICQRALFLSKGQVAGMGLIDEQISSYLREGGQSNGSSGKLPRRLSSELTLAEFKFNPSEIMSGGKITFRMALQSSRPNRVMDCAILLYSERGARVAIIDLRSPNEWPKMRVGGTWLVEGEIESVNLVEGQCFAGLYLKCGDCSGDFLELATFRVVRRNEPRVVAPYDAQYRGLVELEYSFKCVISNAPPSTPA